ncbi:MAG: type I 3-dehydroquinate dehydratase [Phycisphaerae bacterium]|nr:type I 3-dehydroquinate dehydratase [Phycisphaerae bacterium]
MSLIIVSLSGESADAVRADMTAAIEAGADMIELRLDLMPDLTDEDIRGLRAAFTDGPPIILTYRSPAEGGGDSATDAARMARLDELGPTFDYIDVEIATWERSEESRRIATAAMRRADVVSQTGGVEMIEGGSRRKLILSRHDDKGRPASLQADLVRMCEEEACDVPKLAWRARSVRDNFEAFELLRLSPRPAITVCMGEDGRLSRILCRKFGAFATFASLRHGDETAPGQLTIRELRDGFRWSRIGSATHLYGVLGDPIGHSISPDVQNAAFDRTGRDAVYVPIRVTAGPESFKAFMVEVLARPWLDFRGFSVTIPHKENAWRFVNERGRLMDEASRECGAVNTLKLCPDGVVEGWNTDSAAVTGAVSDALGTEQLPAGLSALVLGSGGMARAAAYALSKAGARVTIAGRNEPSARAIADRFGCSVCAWPERDRVSCDLILNCTPIGMHPLTDQSPVSPAALRGGRMVFDSIYFPLQTRLLREAAQAGCRVISGADLFAHQAVAQFTIWTGEDVARSVFHEMTAKAIIDREIRSRAAAEIDR